MRATMSSSAPDDTAQRSFFTIPRLALGDIRMAIELSQRHRGRACLGKAEEGSVAMQLAGERVFRASMFNAAVTARRACRWPPRPSGSRA